MDIINIIKDRNNNIKIKIDDIFVKACKDNDVIKMTYLVKYLSKNNEIINISNPIYNAILTACVFNNGDIIEYLLKSDNVIKIDIFLLREIIWHSTRLDYVCIIDIIMKHAEKHNIKIFEHCNRMNKIIYSSILHVSDTVKYLLYLKKHNYISNMFLYNKYKDNLMFDILIVKHIHTNEMIMFESSSFYVEYYKHNITYIYNNNIFNRECCRIDIDYLKKDYMCMFKNEIIKNY